MKEEMKEKFLPTLVNKIKYSRKVKVADIKSYLVDEFKLTKELDKENNKLKIEIEKFEKERQEHELALVTLDEYKDRIKEKDNQIYRLEKEQNDYKEQITLLTNERNELLVKSKDTTIKTKKIEDDTKRTFKRELESKIKGLTGHITKEIVIELIKGEH